MTEKNEVIIRDCRTQSFRIDDAFVDVFMSIVGDKASCVYMILCRHANKVQEAWPSIAKMVSKSKISENTIIASIRKLELHRIIGVVRGKKPDGSKAVNCYVLLDSRMWKTEPTYPHGTSMVEVGGTAAIAVGVPQTGTAAIAVEGYTTEGNTIEGEQSNAKSADAEHVAGILSRMREQLEAKGVIKKNHAPNQHQDPAG